MSRSLYVAALLSVCSLSFTQLSFAEESRLMTDKMVKANEAVIAQQQAQSAEQTAKAAAGSNADS
ncbi:MULTISPECIES: hypothetical protein [Pseudomonadaceae]|jgi:hypothetical protein|uniref:Secreted protein n=2 Tax=Pseudomonadaceae TaxID=135621 RepID=A0A5R9AEL2_PSENT|nr:MULTISPECIES: hypothetical protein [Pseudomonadaceae]OQR32269.1 hypothetical protein BWR15_20425 [Pseudomonas sp. T]KJJ98716.1 hypothetical protein UB43_18835 [Pseudomonas sp. 21]MBD9515068.1 hypothetical protein [Pseudomonas sp. PDM22]MBD9634409.1 hypothetical protein [Pseudomonas sp. PDM19]MBD9679946.1 hypothetical protein [Pseudomonas sp. PDM18]